MAGPANEEDSDQGHVGAPTRPASPRAADYLTDDEADLVRARHAEGCSLRSIARELDVSPSSLGRWARREGLPWDASRTKAATDATRARLLAQRQQLAESVLADAIELRKRLWDNETQYFPTRDGHEEVVTDLPSARSVEALTSAIERLVRVSEHHGHLTDEERTGEARSMLAKLSEQIGEYVDQLDDDG